MVLFPQVQLIQEAFKDSVLAFKKHLTIFPVSEDVSIPDNRFKVLNRWRLVKRVIHQNKLKPDLVFFPWVDDFRFRKDHPLLDRYFVKWVGWFFPYKWTGLYLHPVHLRVPDSIHNRFHGYDIDDVFKIKNCTSVSVLDEGVREKLEEKIHKPVIRFPDFAEASLDYSSPFTDRLLKAANGRKIILLIGALHNRKGLATLLKTADQSREKNWLFAFAGELFRNDFTAEELELIDKQVENPAENIFLYPNRIKDEGEFNSIINASHVIYAAYLDFPHTSNMLNKASIFKKPLVVARGFYMDETVKQLKIGEVIDESNPDDAKKAIEKILETPGYVNHEMLDGFEIYRERNSISKLGPALGEVLKAAGLE